MPAKIYLPPDSAETPRIEGAPLQYWFHCPGCQCDHAFTVGGSHWTWNGSFDAPTFQPSLLCTKNDPACRCHSFVTHGRIQFLSDCWHSLAGQTVDLPNWEGW